MLYEHRKKLIHDAAMHLNKAEMIRYDITNGFLHITDKGRTASHYYISTDTICRFNEKIRTVFLNDAEIFAIIAQAQEFDQLKVGFTDILKLFDF